MARMVCWNCGASLDEVPRPISRHANCPKCFEDLHCCRLCMQFDPNATGQCQDDRSDPPVQKANANFCDFYRPLLNAYRDERGEKHGDSRARLDALFSGGVETSDRPPTKKEEARAKLDALFKDESDGRKL